jgi:hypothetical protein
MLKRPGGLPLVKQITMFGGARTGAALPSWVLPATMTGTLALTP